MASVQLLRANKRALRKTVMASLRKIPQSSIQEQSRAVVERVLSAPWFQRCRSVSCFMSMPSAEIDTSLLASEILRSGKTLFVPRVDKTTDGRMEFLKLYDEHDLQSLSSGLWGIKEPEQVWQGQQRLSVLDVESEGLDIVLVPGVAFDRSFGRLGHGKGYYDRFIATYKAFATERNYAAPLLAALALRQQILDAEAVPMGEDDFKMDLIVTPDEILSPS